MDKWMMGQNNGRGESSRGLGSGIITTRGCCLGGVFSILPLPYRAYPTNNLNYSISFFCRFLMLCSYMLCKRVQHNTENVATLFLNCMLLHHISKEL